MQKNNTITHNNYNGKQTGECHHPSTFAGTYTQTNGQPQHIMPPASSTAFERHIPFLLPNQQCQCTEGNSKHWPKKSPTHSTPWMTVVDRPTLLPYLLTLTLEFSFNPQWGTVRQLLNKTAGYYVVQKHEFQTTKVKGAEKVTIVCAALIYATNLLSSSSCWHYYILWYHVMTITSGVQQCHSTKFSTDYLSSMWHVQPSGKN